MSRILTILIKTVIPENGGLKVANSLSSESLMFAQCSLRHVIKAHLVWPI